MNRGFAVWLTGMSGAGKSTISRELAIGLAKRGMPVEVLDGDIIRTHLSKGLGYSRDDRDANVARIAFVTSLLVRHGVAVITAAISPYANARADARGRIGRFLEVYVRCPLGELVRRDVKGLYAKALRGEIDRFTGVSDEYEEPKNPDVIVDTDKESVAQSVAKILVALSARNYVRTTEADTLQLSRASD